MASAKFPYDQVSGPRSSVVKEEHIESGFIAKLRELKYTVRPDIRDRATLEANFREKFEALNGVHLSDAEFARLLDEIVTADVFIDTYQNRTEAPRYSRRVQMSEIEKNDFNLNISRYISTAVSEREIDLAATHVELMKIESAITEATNRHNEFLKDLNLPQLPSAKGK